MLKTSYEDVKVDRQDGIAWVTLNRPDKRNAMTPKMHFEMVEILAALEYDSETKVMVLTGAGDSWCAGQDIKLFFRDLDGKIEETARVQEASHHWRWNKLFTYRKPTIAMVNGHCFGGAFTQLIACDFAIAAEDATFGLSEVNWGIMPAGFVAKAITEALSLRDALWYAMTGESFDGRTAEKIRLVNRAVPRERLREETITLATRLMKLSPDAVLATKQALKTVRGIPAEASGDYLLAKAAELRFNDKDAGRSKGMREFLDDKTLRPGISTKA
ncbi:MAG TPA: p-hydroxycinnamoyl CoA hydratase/lyase [Xanthobacteraceae bacterium]|jgi:trans-feruloyl-CoA hydratase/vanillin synthase|nr:p-hydroxycinnamoyl CoA hydratase/lyase [Xanthobacteraceae bacterium]